MCASVAECFLLNMEAQKKYGQSQTFTFGKLVGKIGAFLKGTFVKKVPRSRSFLFSMSLRTRTFFLENISVTKNFFEKCNFPKDAQATRVLQK